MSTPTKEPAAAKAGGKSDAPADAAAAPAPASGGAKAMLPMILALVLAPAATWGTVEFLLLPRLQKKLAVSEPGAHGGEAAAHPPAHGAKGGKGGKEGGPGFEFQNVVVNLAGTMGTRYLKTSFVITGEDPNIKAVFEGSKPKLTDVTLNVLSSLTLADLEEPGAKNLIREKLVGAYNQALGRKVADQVYFSDFVIQ